MKTINCILIDDEPLAFEILENYLSSYKNIKIIGKFTDPKAALNCILSQNIDLIFSDINMPFLSGMELLDSVSKNTLVVLTTAHEKYAVKAFEKDILDFLLKPISFSRFSLTMKKVFERVQSIDVSKKYTFFKVNKKFIRVELDSILYIESLKDYVNIKCTSESIRVHKTLSSIVDELPEDKFLRIHRSYCISLDKLSSVDGNIICINDYKIPVGRNYLKDFRKRVIDIH